MRSVVIHIQTLTESIVEVDDDDRAEYGAPNDSWEDIAIAKHDAEGWPEAIITCSKTAVKVRDK